MTDDHKRIDVARQWMIAGRGTSEQLLDALDAVDPLRQVPGDFEAAVEAALDGWFGNVIPPHLREAAGLAARNREGMSRALTAALAVLNRSESGEIERLRFERDYAIAKAARRGIEVDRQHDWLVEIMSVYESRTGESPIADRMFSMAQMAVEGHACEPLAVGRPHEEHIPGPPARDPLDSGRLRGGGTMDDPAPSPERPPSRTVVFDSVAEVAALKVRLAALEHAAPVWPDGCTYFAVCGKCTGPFHCMTRFCPHAGKQITPDSGMTGAHPDQSKMTS